MNVNLHTQTASVPTVFVTKGRQRVKQYENTIYLKNGDEFEIELFNPTTNKVLAKISLNGKPLSSGVVLRPGERVFLERYLDEAKKFLFETYEVDGNDAKAVEAIKLNGIVDVEFYDEYKQPYVVTYTNAWPQWIYYPQYAPPYPCNPPYTPWIYTSSGTYSGNTVTCSNNNNSNFTNGNVNGIPSSGGAKSCSMSNNAFVSYSAQVGEPVSKETGRVEKGSYSDQSFKYDNTSFNYYCSWKYTWKILPESQRPYMKEDLKVFCVNCGSRRKKASHTFCPNCGQKF